MKAISIRAEHGTQGVMPISIGVDVVNISSSAGANSAFTLPPADPATIIHVTNNSGAAVLVYPSAGDSIADLAANAAATLPDNSGRAITFIAQNNALWSLSDIVWR